MSELRRYWNPRLQELFFSYQLPLSMKHSLHIYTQGLQGAMKKVLIYRYLLLFIGSYTPIGTYPSDRQENNHLILFLSYSKYSIWHYLSIYLPFNCQISKDNILKPVEYLPLRKRYGYLLPINERLPVLLSYLKPFLLSFALILCFTHCDY